MFIIPEALQKGFNGINSLGFHRVTKLLQMVEQKEAIGAVPVKGVFRYSFDHLLSFPSLYLCPTSLYPLYFIYLHLLSQVFHHCGRKCLHCKELLHSNFHIYLKS